MGNLSAPARKEADDGNGMFGSGIVRVLHVRLAIIQRGRTIAISILAILSRLVEQQRRWVFGLREVWRRRENGGIQQVAEITDYIPKPFASGRDELRTGSRRRAEPIACDFRVADGHAWKKDPAILKDLARLVRGREPPATPAAAEKWVRSRMRKLVESMVDPPGLPDHSRPPVAKARLRTYAAIAKCCAPASHMPNGTNSFSHIAGKKPRRVRRRGDPRISVDTKKKELVGNFKNPGQSWRGESGGSGTPTTFRRMPECRASQYGFTDPERNEGRCAWQRPPTRRTSPVDAISALVASPPTRTIRNGSNLMIRPADGGGSNAGAVATGSKRGYRTSPSESGLEITVCHYPPGTSM